MLLLIILIQKYFMSSINLLQRYYPNYNQQKQINLLVKIETYLSQWGLRLYGASWQSNQCALVDANGNPISTTAQCGDRQNPPNCPVP